MNLPVPISIIASFKRMRHFKPRSAIVAALKESEVLNVVENDSCVQRKEALPEDFQDKAMNEIVQVHEDEAMSRSVYAKGFGEEEPSTQFDIEAYFAAYGPTNSVRLRRTFDRKFKGSVFVEFDSEETQHSFLAVDPKPKWKGSDLLIKSKKQYCDEKVEEIKCGRVKANTTHWQPRYDYNKSKSGERDWRDRRKEDQKSGFQDKRRGSHKGFGSSGRGGGRGGGRGSARGGARDGGRGGRDNRDKFDKRDKSDKRGNGRDEQYDFYFRTVFQYVKSNFSTVRSPKSPPRQRPPTIRPPHPICQNLLRFLLKQPNSIPQAQFLQQLRRHQPRNVLAKPKWVMTRKSPPRESTSRPARGTHEVLCYTYPPSLVLFSSGFRHHHFQRTIQLSKSTTYQPTNPEIIQEYTGRHLVSPSITSCFLSPSLSLSAFQKQQS